MPAIAADNAPTGVTLVVPFRNRAALLPRLLTSLQALTRWPEQVVMVDNGSTDASALLCERFIAQHADRPICLAAEPTPGACAARNRGLSLCQTPFVYFFDSDDELSPTFFADLAPHLTADIDLLAVPTRVESRGRLRMRVYHPTADPADQVLLSHLNTQAMVLRADFLRRAGGWNVACPLWNDWELGLRLLCARPRMRWLTETPYHVIHRHADSLTGPGLAPRIGGILQTLRQSLAVCGADERLRRALWLRHSILSGQCTKEGDPEAARQCDAQTNLLFGRSPHPFLRRYAACGGRGAWLLARWLL